MALLLANWSGSVHQPIWIRPLWPPQVARGLFSFRLGGVSKAPFDSLNVGLHVADEPSHVLANRTICANELAGERTDWVVAEQVHGSQVAVVEREDKGRGSAPEYPAIAGTDALVTAVPGITLVVMSADCVPVLFLDPVKRVAATAHSGWKGTVGHIVRNVVTTMVDRFASNPADIHVWLGPSIRRCCYEVNDVVAEPVRQAFGARHLVHRFGKEGKYLLSLQSCVRSDLQDAGVLSRHIVDTGVCTSCHSDVLFSHRADHGRTGRILGAVRLV